mmetsp:Transcript_1248/g.4085  ORF Transcript_1248/g.4085 Transcript_1248/m.4085 type:complete len:243 (-) Transcript_1248:2176-2904(-)
MLGSPTILLSAQETFVWSKSVAAAPLAMIETRLSNKWQSTTSPRACWLRCTAHSSLSNTLECVRLGKPSIPLLKWTAVPLPLNSSFLKIPRPSEWTYKPSLLMRKAHPVMVGLPPWATSTPTRLCAKVVSVTSGTHCAPSTTSPVPPPAKRHLVTCVRAELTTRTAHFSTPTNSQWTTSASPLFPRSMALAPRAKWHLLMRVGRSPPPPLRTMRDVCVVSVHRSSSTVPVAPAPMTTQESQR